MLIGGPRNPIEIHTERRRSMTLLCTKKRSSIVSAIKRSYSCLKNGHLEGFPRFIMATFQVAEAGTRYVFRPHQCAHISAEICRLMYESHRHIYKTSCRISIIESWKKGIVEVMFSWGLVVESRHPSCTEVMSTVCSILPTTTDPHNKLGYQANPSWSDC